MKVKYITPITIPSRSADSVQVMKACESLQKIGVNVNLHLPFRKDHEQLENQVFSFYDCETSFNIKWEKNLLLPERYSILKIAIKAGLSDCDVVITRSIPAGLLVALIGQKVVVEIHEPLDRSWPITLFSSLLVRLNNTRGIITNCNALKLHTIRRYPRFQNKTTAIHNAAWAVKDVVPIDLGDKSRIHVGYSGQLYKGKGMEVITKLAPIHPEIMFHIVGGLPEDIEFWKNELNEAANVVFHGFIQPSQLTRYIAAFNIVLAPYQRVIYGYKANNNLSEWTSPMKIFDYMSLGKPIIASDLDFMHEVLKPDQQALFCDPDDISAWSKAITRFSNDPEFAKRLGTAAQEKFLNEYTWEKRAEKVLRFIQTVSKI